MALAKLAPILEDVIGSIGQDTFSRVRAGLIIKGRSYPGSQHTFTPTQSQLNIQTMFRNCAGHWKNLSDTQIQDWCALAAIIPDQNKFHESYFQAGFNLYCKVQQNIQLIGGAVYDDAPGLPLIPHITSLTLQISSDPSPLIDINYLPDPTYINVAHIIYATPPVSAGRFYVKNKYRKIDVLPPNTSPKYFIETAYYNLFPLPTANQKIFVKLIPIHTITGFSDSPIITSAIYTP